MKNEFFSSGEFAARSKIPKKTLLYYDEIGLLKPGKVDSNRYRYYHFSQLTTASKIKALQAIGMSLKEIKEAIGLDDVDSGLALLEKQRILLREKLDSLQNDLAQIDRAAENLCHYKKTGLGVPFYQQIPPTPIHAIAFSSLPVMKGPQTFHKMAGAILPENYSEGSKPLYLYSLPLNPQEHNHVIPGGRYYCCYLSGFYLRGSTMKFISLCNKNAVSTVGDYIFTDVSGGFVQGENKGDIHKISVLLKD